MRYILAFASIFFVFNIYIEAEDSIALPQKIETQQPYVFKIATLSPENIGACQKKIAQQIFISKMAKGAITGGVIAGVATGLAVILNVGGIKTNLISTLSMSPTETKMVEVLEQISGKTIDAINAIETKGLEEVKKGVTVNSSVLKKVAMGVYVKGKKKELIALEYEFRMQVYKICEIVSKASAKAGTKKDLKIKGIEINDSWTTFIDNALKNVKSGMKNCISGLGTGSVAFLKWGVVFGSTSVARQIFQMQLSNYTQGFLKIFKNEEELMRNWIYNADMITKKIQSEISTLPKKRNRQELEQSLKYIEFLHTNMLYYLEHFSAYIIYKAEKNLIRDIQKSNMLKGHIEFFGQKINSLSKEVQSEGQKMLAQHSSAPIDSIKFAPDKITQGINSLLIEYQKEIQSCFVSTSTLLKA